MADTLRTMLDYFQSSKQAGSYFMLYLLCIILMYYLNKDKHKWFILYGIALMLVVVMNPFTVWLLSKAFGALAIYEPFTCLIPIFLYIPFTVAELLDSITDTKRRHILLLVIVFFISICGNLCGFYQKNTLAQTNVVSGEEADIVEYLEERQATLVLADEEIIPVITENTSVPLLYGKDMWTYGMDLGIQDGYTEAERELYEAMSEPEVKANYIASSAYECGCDIIVMKRFEGQTAYLGPYTIAKQTEGYLVYEIE